MPSAHRDCIAHGKVVERFGKVLLARHLRAAKQHRDNDNAALQCCCDLANYIVGRIVNSGKAVLPFDGQPLVTDHDDHGAGFFDLLVDDLFKIRAVIDPGDVPEDAAAAEMRGQGIGQTPGKPARIRATIVHEDLVVFRLFAWKPHAACPAPLIAKNSRGGIPPMTLPLQ